MSLYEFIRVAPCYMLIMTAPAICIRINLVFRLRKKIMNICMGYNMYLIGHGELPQFSLTTDWWDKLPSVTAMIYKYSFSSLKFERWFTQEEVEELMRMKKLGTEYESGRSTT